MVIILLSFLLQKSDKLADRTLAIKEKIKYLIAEIVQGVVTITGLVVAPEPEPEPQPEDGGGGGGGGGGGMPLPSLPTKIIFKGWAYPLSKVVVLKDGQRFVETQANSQAKFRAEISNISPGIYSFGIWAEDKNKRKSITHTLTFQVRANTIHEISDIFLPPTVELSKSAILRGQILDIFGQTVPQSQVEIYINSDKIIEKVTADALGGWFYSLDTNRLERGIHTARVRASISNDLLSTFSQVLMFGVGVDLPPAKGVCPRADLNKDGKVNLIDFSILLYWWGRYNECADQNSDGVVNLIDFSIMLYYWTG